MIIQITSPGDFPANGPAYDGGSVYAVRVVQFSAGATISFDAQKSTRKILGYFAYRNAKEPGWTKIWLTGACVIELATSPEESFGGSGVAGVAAIDVNQNSVVVGPDAPAIAPTGNPVQLGGVDTAGLVRRVAVDPGGRLRPGAGNKSTFLYNSQRFVANGSNTTATPVFLAALWHLVGATKRVEIKRIRVEFQNAASGLAAGAVVDVGKATAAPTGGTVYVPASHDGADAIEALAYEQVAGNIAQTTYVPIKGTVRFVAGAFLEWEWRAGTSGEKAIVLRAATLEGIALRLSNGGALGANAPYVVEIEFTEE